MRSTPLTTLSLFTLTCSILLTSACIMGVRGNGVERVERRAINANEIRRVDAPGGAFDTIDIYVCDCEEVIITGDENLLEYVNTHQVVDTLIIDTDQRLDPDLPLKVEIYTRYIDEVSTSGSSNIRVVDLSGGDLLIDTSGSSDVKLKGELDTLRVETSGSSDFDIVELSARAIELDTSGSSDISLVGESESLDIRTSGSSDIDAEDLVVVDATVHTSGSSDVDLCVTGTLDVTISGSADVTYSCRPQMVTRSISGSGSLVARD